MTSAICKPFASIAIDEKKTALTLVLSVDSANEVLSKFTFVLSVVIAREKEKYGLGKKDRILVASLLFV